MTRPKRQRGYYVIARPANDPGRWKLLVGPFTTFRAASMMCEPVRRATRVQGWDISADEHRAVKLPRGSLPLTDIEPSDVIEASKRP